MHSDSSSWFEIIVGLVVGALQIWFGIEMIRTPIWIQGGPFFYQMIARFMQKWGPDRARHEPDYRYPVEDVRRVGRWYIVGGCILEAIFIALLIWGLVDG